VIRGDPEAIQTSDFFLSSWTYRLKTTRSNTDFDEQTFSEISSVEQFRVEEEGDWKMGVRTSTNSGTLHKS